MDAETCVKKLSYIGVLYFATVDEHGAPQVRNISAIHYEPDALYFFTARGKEFCRQLLADGRVQISGYTMYKENIRLSGRRRRFPRRSRRNGSGLFLRSSPIWKMCIPEIRKKSELFSVSGDSASSILIWG